jgi:hypothetical protein
MFFTEDLWPHVRGEKEFLASRESADPRLDGFKREKVL